MYTYLTTIVLEAGASKRESQSRVFTSHAPKDKKSHLPPCRGFYKAGDRAFPFLATGPDPSHTW